MSRQIVLDTETTGLLVTEGHRLIEIGCLELINRRPGKQLHYYLNPQRSIDQGALQVHGITQEFLQNKPLFSQVAEELIAFIKGAELIIHNAPFDTGFLNAEFRLLSKNYVPIENFCTIIDTLLLARQKHPGQSNSLDALCRRYQVDNTHRDLHGALLDARLLAQVYLAMTGGQELLFENEERTPAVSMQLDEINAAGILPPQHKIQYVLEPTDEELKAHQEFLAKILRT